MNLKQTVKKDAQFLSEMADKLSKSFGSDRVLVSKEAKKILHDFHEQTVKLKDFAVQRHSELVNEELPNAVASVKSRFKRKKSTNNDQQNG